MTIPSTALNFVPIKFG